MDYKKILYADLIVFILILSMMPFVQATDFSLDIDAVKSRIQPGDNGEYKLTITNYDSQEQLYRITPSAPNAASWIITPTTAKVLPGETKDVILKIIPKSTVGLGTHAITIQVEDRNNEMQQIKALISIVIDAYLQGYLPDVALTVDSPSKQDPREKLSITILTKNRNPLDLENLILEIQSDFFYKRINTSLGPRKEITKEYIFELDSLQKPGDYDLDVKLMLEDDTVVSQTTKKLTIEQYSTINTDKNIQKGFLSSKEEITLTNEGNYPREKSITVLMPWYERIFVKTYPQGELIKENGKAALKWTENLKPTESKTIIIIRNYVVLAIIMLLIIILIALYFIIRSPIILLKEAQIVKEDSEGISEIKVRLFIKNRSGKTTHNITITDLLPRIASLEKQPGILGSLQPTKVTHTSKKGTLLYWDIEYLEPFEERIITYKMSTKLKIVGNLNLSRTQVKFDTKSGKEKRTESSQPIFVK
ncbi:hypothetical protein K9L97_04425 [Candidatus Woesearchaeota archaeon]|nr:hypothetical protein [Candidatus Woesearchaeota archaeon]